MDKQLIIIGNGFDVKCKLNSKYSDFYKAMIKGKYQSSGNARKEFWRSLLCVYDTEIESYNWCNIENIIKETLNITDKLLFDKAMSCIKDRGNGTRTLIAPQTGNKINDFITAYCSNYINYVIYEKQYLSSIEFIKMHLYNHLFEELKSLEALFCSFLKKQIDEKYRSRASTLLNKLYSNQSNHEDIKRVAGNIPVQSFYEDASVLSFNYTTPLIGIRKKSSLSYSNVHGMLCGDDCQSCPSSNIIFGIDDSVIRTNEKEKQNQLRIFSKTYRTLFLPENCQAKVLPPCDLEGTIIIKFFGHSLDAADYSYFQSIFDYYDIYSNDSVYLEFYYSPHGGEDINLIRKNKTDAVYKLMNDYGNTLSNQYQGKNLMHKLILEQRIKIKNLGM